MEKRYERVKRACFLTSLSTAATNNLPPLLFLTFRDRYAVSFSLLGLLVVLNYGTQLLFDAVFSFFSHRFDIHRSVRLTPVLMTAGMGLFAAAPALFPGHVYAGLALATAVFSAGSGLAEVLVSPTVAAIPDPDSDRLMSRLHACYAWGTLFVVGFSTGFIALAGTGRWQLLTVLLAALPLTAAMLMAGAELPPMETPARASAAVGVLRQPGVGFYMACIFLGGASECTMSQWCSGYLETAMGLPKAVGDLCGFALFGALLGLGRSLYGRYGKNIHGVLFAGALGAAVCYLTAVLSPWPLVGLAGCALTGFCTSMLWPGSLIAVAERAPRGGVALYALMAMGGDLGASICPQLVGLAADGLLAAPWSASLAEALGMGSEQLAMRAGLGLAALFPMGAAALFFTALRRSRKGP